MAWGSPMVPLAGHSHGIEHAIQDCGHNKASEISRISQGIQKEIKSKKLFEKFGRGT